MDATLSVNVATRSPADKNDHNVAICSCTSPKDRLRFSGPQVLSTKFPRSFTEETLEPISWLKINVLDAVETFKLLLEKETWA